MIDQIVALVGCHDDPLIPCGESFDCHDLVGQFCRDDGIGAFFSLMFTMSIKGSFDGFEIVRGMLDTPQVKLHRIGRFAQIITGSAGGDFIVITALPAVADGINVFDGRQIGPIVDTTAARVEHHRNTAITAARILLFGENADFAVATIMAFSDIEPCIHVRQRSG
jgi:hypothetical protein